MCSQMFEDPQLKSPLMRFGVLQQTAVATLVEMSAWELNPQLFEDF